MLLRNFPSHVSSTKAATFPAMFARLLVKSVFWWWNPRCIDLEIPNFVVGVGLNHVMYIYIIYIWYYMYIHVYLYTYIHTCVYIYIYVSSNFWSFLWTPSCPNKCPPVSCLSIPCTSRLQEIHGCQVQWSPGRCCHQKVTVADFATLRVQTNEDFSPALKQQFYSGVCWQFHGALPFFPVAKAAAKSYLTVWPESRTRLGCPCRLTRELEELEK